MRRGGGGGGDGGDHERIVNTQTMTAVRVRELDGVKQCTTTGDYRVDCE